MKLIVAVARDWGIGNKGELLFNVPQDMDFFKKTTLNKVVVMGRKTLLSLPGGKPLINRTNIVLTRDVNFEKEGCIVVNSTEALFEELKNYNSDDVFLIGGGKLYNELYPFCSEAYITKFDAVLEADTYLHNFEEDKDWLLTYASELHEHQGLRFIFTTYKNLAYEKGTGGLPINVNSF
ncbi:MAG TPA: dihydrofolate reductase [Sedimentibacter sp.]|nr:dihydrofolate reductase [Sedimentibacter sp.]HNZ82516.1 dihydrofolate reductase [Sedimentibacter sp.]HOH69098.1 dihydrofolate reductase [Sedimentibacter sp.]HPW99142.1 dihydrofolate reductase [Sedimentibacter sp.]HQB63408.1 dihydrofolate reductase [Sedimentibacter sp.]